ncbi:alcohol dehydrogenase 4 [Luminiphilus syltensis NOR5-1B]|uniref:Alcohol dehydrogenase 4 n=1 Tax=Luminiphilus syltensis NOR5-1B TaxID=565045 RepID=B8KVE1_9GAMM|nr:iron-containing alcohol dehydrogenase [Luminiphilus syltensis]EED34596.1 alcohol dehydrogenase 4 [Luminiphilus syltensis NOR5-1B]
MPSVFKTAWYRALLTVKKQIVMQPQPRPVVYVGAESSHRLCDSLAQFGLRKVLVVTDMPLVAAHIPQPLISRIESHGITTVVYDEVMPDPTIGVVDNGLSLLRRESCDGVLAIGGGSVIDAAKVIALAAANGFQAKDCVGLKKSKRLRYRVCGATTAGTGSEVTIAAVISDDLTHEKLIVADPRIIPTAAALDPVISKTLPPAITAATGMDALTHAIESYTNTWDTPECLHYGRLATRLILQNLERACLHGDDLEAREAMALASYYAGLAFSTCLVGYVHAFSHQLGTRYGTPHGLANAVVLPHVLKLLKGACSMRLAELAVYCNLGEEQESADVLAQKLIDRIVELSHTVDIPNTVESLREVDFDAIIARALKEGSGYPVPRFIDYRECKDILRRLI